jgi:cyclopropane-fatty-acyl-phospholipid synthase
MLPSLQRVFASFIRTGNLRVTIAKGRTHVLGDGSGKPIAVRFTTAAAAIGAMLDPELKLGEAYMNGTFIVEEGSIADFLALGLSQDDSGNPPLWARWQIRPLWRRLQRFYRRGRRTQKKAAYHYDLSGPFSSLLFDADRQFSCAYFERPDQSLDDAQLAKKRHIAAKLLVKRGSHVLDIGSGWGGLALYLSENCGARVKGITVSKEQLTGSQARVDEKGLKGSIEFCLEDYRDVTGAFDRIVAVEMIEHLGIDLFDSYFRKCAELIAEDGVMLLHSIGRSEGPDITNPFISKYISPGYVPTLSEVVSAIERAGLLVSDIEILRLHYAETVKAWREKFLAHRAEIEQLYDARFCRMWEFILACWELASRTQGVMVFQIQITKRQGVVPITRDYIAAEEARLRVLEGAAR